MDIDECKRIEKCFSKTLLLCDMDGTLLNSNHQISEENQAALNDFVDNGGWFTVATGRREGSIMNYASKLPINAPAILYNGAVIYDFNEKKVLWKNCLPAETMGIVADLAAHFPGLGIEIFHNDNVYFYKQNEYTMLHEKIDRFSPCILPVELIPKPWYKVLLTWDPERLKDVALFLNTYKEVIRAVFSEPHYLELTSKNASKDHALGQLIKILDISYSDVISIGDNLNDLEMIKISGTGIAVGNSHPELKKIAKLCCCHNDEHSIPDALRLVRKRMDSGS